MGSPILNGPSVPTTLPPTQGSAVVAAPLEVLGTHYTVTAVSMGNPHAVVYSAGGAPVKVGRAAWVRGFGLGFRTHSVCFPEGGGGGVLNVAC